jgi:hypothetical protein
VLCRVATGLALSLLGDGRRQLSWPPDDNYPGRWRRGNSLMVRGSWLSCLWSPFERLFGKRSASGRRHRSGSGGQATHPAGAVHRLVLWAGGLSTAGECAQAVAGVVVVGRARRAEGCAACAARRR